MYHEEKNPAIEILILRSKLLLIHKLTIKKIVQQLFNGENMDLVLFSIEAAKILLADEDRYELENNNSNPKPR